MNEIGGSLTHVMDPGQARRPIIVEEHLKIQPLNEHLYTQRSARSTPSATHLQGHLLGPGIVVGPFHDTLGLPPSKLLRRVTSDTVHQVQTRPAFPRRDAATSQGLLSRSGRPKKVPNPVETSRG